MEILGCQSFTIKIIFNHLISDVKLPDIGEEYMYG